MESKNTERGFAYLAIFLSLLATVYVSLDLFYLSPEKVKVVEVPKAPDTVSVDRDSLVLSRLEALENRMEANERRGEATREQMVRTISGERTAYATFLSLIAALLGLVGFGFVRDIRSKVNRLESKTSEVTSRADNLEREAKDLKWSTLINRASTSRVYAAESERQGDWSRASFHRLCAIDYITRIDSISDKNKQELERSIDQLLNNLNITIQDNISVEEELYGRLIDRVLSILSRDKDFIEDDMKEAKRRIFNLDVQN